MRKYLLVMVCLILTTVQVSFATTFDHEHKAWDQMLKDYTSQANGQTFVGYAKWKAKGGPSLDAYLKSLSGVSEKDFSAFDSNQKLSFLINAYNAFTVKLILDSFPVKSIKETGTIFTGPWKKKFFSLLGKEMFLDGIEHDLIRKKFNEPRIHFAVNCASIGCPSLRTSAYTGTKLQEELSQAEKDFFMNPAKFKIVGNKFLVSSILDWYGEDFVKKHGDLKRFLVERALFYKILKNPLKPTEVQLEFPEYDWNLNGN